MIREAQHAAPRPRTGPGARAPSGPGRWTRALLGATGLALTAGGAPVLAQEAGPESVRAVLAGQTEGRLLRVHERSGRLLSGTYTGLAADSLRLGPPGPDVTVADAVRADLTIPLGQVQRLERRGRSTARGAWITGLAGALAGGFLGAAFHGLCESDCGTRTETVLWMGTVTGGAGAIFGAIVGAAIPRWHGIWP